MSCVQPAAQNTQGSALALRLVTHNKQGTPAIAAPVSTADPLAEQPSAQLVAIVTAGLEQVAAAEIERLLHLPAGAVTQICMPPRSAVWVPNPPASCIFPGAAGVSKLLFSAPAATAADGSRLFDRICRLKPVQMLLALVATASDVSLDRSGLLQIAEAAGTADAARWESALATWRATVGQRGGPQHNRSEPNITAPSRTAHNRKEQNNIEESNRPEAEGENTHATPRGPEGKERWPQPRFRASCLRDGQHAFTSVEAAAELGGAIHRRFGWSVDLQGYDFDVSAFLLQRELLLGINLNGSQSRIRGSHGPAEPRPLLPYCEIRARLRPSTAWLMLQLAEICEGDVVLDPMCGVGTIPLEAAATCGGTFTLAGDVDADLVRQAHANAQLLAKAHTRAAAGALSLLPLRSVWAERPGGDEADAGCNGDDACDWHYERRVYERLHAGGGMQSCQWSATKLPLRTACVDACVIDLPFGMVHNARNATGAKRYGVKELYKLATAELARVLRPGGRLVMLSPAKRFLQEIREARRELWEEVHCLDVNCGGIIACVLVWRRSRS